MQNARYITSATPWQFRVSMNREKAVDYLKELLGKCDKMSPDSVSFERNNGDAVGYRVHITGAIHECDRQVIQEIAQKRNLTVKNNGEGIVVYESK